MPLRQPPRPEPVLLAHFGARRPSPVCRAGRHRSGRPPELGVYSDSSPAATRFHAYTPPERRSGPTTKHRPSRRARCGVRQSAKPITTGIRPLRHPGNRNSAPGCAAAASISEGSSKALGALGHAPKYSADALSIHGGDHPAETEIKAPSLGTINQATIGDTNSDDGQRPPQPVVETRFSGNARVKTRGLVCPCCPSGEL